MRRMQESRCDGGLAGTDAAVFLAGDPEGLNVDRVDLGGTVIGTEVAASLSIPRWIQVSALGAVGTVPRYLQKALWPHYLEAKAARRPRCGGERSRLNDREARTTHRPTRSWRCVCRSARGSIQPDLSFGRRRDARLGSSASRRDDIEDHRSRGGHEPLATTLAAAFDAAPREA
jgi:hypothetical protein